jgi:hypothetical protein
MLKNVCDRILASKLEDSWTEKGRIYIFMCLLQKTYCIFYISHGMLHNCIHMNLIICVWKKKIYHKEVKHKE